MKKICLVFLVLFVFCVPAAYADDNSFAKILDCDTTIDNNHMAMRESIETLVLFQLKQNRQITEEAFNTLRNTLEDLRRQDREYWERRIKKLCQ